ncbi:MAG: hypothetical protein K5867_05910 [Bacteroidales bacterium]|nr:hypothetical protein [Bacteroidales bacterium]
MAKGIKTIITAQDSVTARIDLMRFVINFIVLFVFMKKFVSLHFEKPDEPAMVMWLGVLERDPIFL